MFDMFFEALKFDMFAAKSTCSHCSDNRDQQQWLTDQSTNAKIVSNVDCESASVVDAQFASSCCSSVERYSTRPLFGSFPGLHVLYITPVVSVHCTQWFSHTRKHQPSHADPSPAHNTVASPWQPETLATVLLHWIKTSNFELRSIVLYPTSPSSAQPTHSAAGSTRLRNLHSAGKSASLLHALQLRIRPGVFKGI